MKPRSTSILAIFLSSFKSRTIVLFDFLVGLGGRKLEGETTAGHREYRRTMEITLAQSKSLMDFYLFSD